MANRSSVVLEAEEQAIPLREVPSDEPFRILVMGNFSGRADRRLHPVAVDLDNFDDVMSRMLPSLRLSGADLQFRALDDFHPDHIYRTAAIFQKLAELRYQPPRTAAATSGGSLLDSILEQTPEISPSAAAEAGDLAAFIRKVTAPHLEDRPDAGKQAWTARIAAANTDLMRAVLHHPEFQALESAWRAAWMLVQGVGDDVKVYLLDTTLDEIMASPEALAGTRWTLLVGNFAFGDSEADTRNLRFLGRLAKAAGAPFLAEGQPPSDEAVPQHWQQLRASDEAHWLGLVLPRFLLRLPYGKSTSPVEAFPFEEMTGSVHAEYLWGNPAFACAYLMGRSRGTERRIGGLPLHVYRSEGAAVNKPCGEVLMSEKDAAFLMDRGFMPLASLKDQDAVLLVRFQSIAQPTAALAGHWSE
jgi:type VI secretion system protein ImpC